MMQSRGPYRRAIAIVLSQLLAVHVHELLCGREEKPQHGSVQSCGKPIRDEGALFLDIAFCQIIGSAL